MSDYKLSAWTKPEPNRVFVAIETPKAPKEDPKDKKAAPDGQTNPNVKGLVIVRKADTESEGAFELVKLIVAPERRGYGLGSHLVRHSLEYIKTRVSTFTFEMKALSPHFLATFSGGKKGSDCR